MPGAPGAVSGCARRLPKKTLAPRPGKALARRRAVPGARSSENNDERGATRPQDAQTQRRLFCKNTCKAANGMYTGNMSNDMTGGRQRKRGDDRHPASRPPISRVRPAGAGRPPAPEEKPILPPDAGSHRAKSLQTATASGRFPMISNDFQSLFKNMRAKWCLPAAIPAYRGRPCLKVPVAPATRVAARQCPPSAGQSPSRRMPESMMIFGEFQWFPINSNQFQSLFKKYETVGFSIYD